MTQIVFMACKDCGEPFTYSEEAASRDRREGRSAPERCPQCRPKHSREYRALGVSHNDVLQLRRDGVGGLAQFLRERPAPQWQGTARAPVKPMPIEEVIGPLEKPGTVLHGLLHDPRRVHVVVGPTGSGKSTWLPFRLLTCEELVARGPIVITQPRIPATTGPAEFVAELYYGDRKLLGPGLAIGYRYSEIGSSMTDSANRLVFMTDGTLLNEIQSGEIRRYSLVIIDEAHERSFNIDKILALLRLKLDRFPHLQVMISSATVDAKTFEAFFGGADRVALYEGRGFTYPILDVFADETLAHCLDLWGDAGGRDSVWEAVDEATRARELLGAACWRYRAFPAWQLRYYPAFEALVFQGVMSSTVRDELIAASRDPGWQAAIDELARRSQRRRSVGTGNIGLLESIRGVATRPPRSGPATVPREVTQWLVHAVAAEIVSVIERDRAEAPRRLARWQSRARWQDLGWDATTGDGWTKLRCPLPVGHVLAFLPTSSAINECTELVTRHLRERGWDKDNVVLRFFREAPDEEKKRATAGAGEIDPIGVRKIVIGSNLAETSLTLDGVVYVVESGLICEEYYDVARGGKWLPTVLHSQAGCRQRVGRVGRKEPGEAYRLYTREELMTQALYTTPQIARASPEAVVLDLVQAGVPPTAGALQAALMSAPQPRDVERAIGDLRRFEAIDADGDVTARGLELAATPAESFLASQLLCEADRFGALWEMAIFLALLSLKDVKGLDGRWFALWEPTDAPVYDDVEESEEDGKQGRRREEDPAWRNPYFVADVLTKRLALLEVCRDDLELYLRVWQGWFASRTEEARREWARTHGVSHRALTRVQVILGLSEAAEQGTLRAFWDFGQKGMMSRDVDFTRLDVVRFLYAAGYPDRIHRRQSDQDTTFTKHPAARGSRPTKLHRESVWATPGAERLPAPDDPGQRLWCVASVQQGQGGPGNQSLRHVVWLSPDWFEGGPPSFEMSPAPLARRLIPLVDRARSACGSAPFVDGVTRAGFRWPVPSVPQPTALQVEQWRTRLGSFVGTGAAVRATVAHRVHYPRLQSKPLVFVQIPGGPLVPCEVQGQATLSVGHPLEVQLAFRDGFLWAAASPPSAGRAAHQVEREQAGSSAPAGGRSGVEPVRGNVVVSLQSPRDNRSIGRTGRPVAAPSPPQIPENLVLAAEVVAVEASEDFHGFVVRVTQDPYGGMELHVESDLPEVALRKEATSGRALMVRAGREWRGRRRGSLEQWSDGARPMTLVDAWPINTRLTAEVVEGYRSLCRVRVIGVRGREFQWNAVHEGKRGELHPGTRVRVRITEWKTGAGDPWPHLIVETLAG